MCGLFGIDTRSRSRDPLDRTCMDLVLDELADDMAMRGRDSWGIALPRGVRGAIMIRKGLGSISKIVLPDSDRMLAHTRLATVGEVSKPNAHPFLYNGCAVAHNGAIWNHAEMARKLGQTFPVDSMVLAYQIATKGDVSALTGYGAVHWTDGERSYVCRMRDGDLEAATITTPSGGRHIVWASRLYDVSLQNFRAYGFTVSRWPTLREGKVYRVAGDRLVGTGRRIDLARGSYSYGWGDTADWGDEWCEVQPRVWRKRKTAPTLAIPVRTSEDDDTYCPECARPMLRTRYYFYSHECVNGSCTKHGMMYCPETDSWER